MESPAAHHALWRGRGNLSCRPVSFVCGVARNLQQRPRPHRGPTGTWMEAWNLLAGGAVVGVIAGFWGRIKEVV
jgi:hypothetical protein